MIQKTYCSVKSIEGTAMRLLRERYLIVLMIFAVPYAAALLLFRIYIDPYSSRGFFLFRVVVGTALTLTSLALVLAVVFRRPFARCISIGLVLGAALENRAFDYYATHGLLRFTPGTWVSEGWYPLTVPVERALIARGWGNIAEPPLLAVFAGMGRSGILCGVLLVTAVGWWRRLARIKQGTPPAV